MRWIEITALLINLAVLSMGAAQLSDFSVKSVHDFLLDDSGSCSKVVDYFLERSYKYNPKLNAIITFNSRLKADALKIDEEYQKSGFKGRLHCVPIIVKDNIDVKELPMTGGIKALRYSIPNRDALVVKRLKDEGALVLAKSNLAELAAGERLVFLFFV
jgi:amidase